MVVANWEFNALANMLVATHGLDAIAEATERMDNAKSRGASGEAVVWSAALDRLPALLKDYAQRLESLK